MEGLLKAEGIQLKEITALQTPLLAQDNNSPPLQEFKACGAIKIKILTIKPKSSSSTDKIDLTLHTNNLTEEMC